MDTGACADPSQTCKEGACRTLSTLGANSSADAGQDAQAVTPAPAADSGTADADSGVVPPSEPDFSSEGTTVAVVVAQEVTQVQSDGTWVSYVRSGKNAFGVNEAVLEVTRADGSMATPLEVKGGFPIGKIVPATLLNGAVYWIESGLVLKKAIPGASELQLWNAPSEVVQLKALGQRLYMLSPSTQPTFAELWDYDAVNSIQRVRDTTAPSLWNPMYAAVNAAGLLFWGHGSRSDTELAIFSEGVTAGAQDTGARVPGNVTQFGTFAVEGTKVIFTVTDGGNTSIRTVETSPAGAAVELATAKSSGIGVLDSGSLYLDVARNSAVSDSIVRYSLTSGTPTLVVDFKKNALPVRVCATDASNVYFTETLDNSKGRSVRIARAPK